MTNEELKNFILCGSIHTLSIRTMDDVKAVPKSMKKTVRCISRKTERGMQTTCFLNLHLIDGEIYSYLQFKEKLDMVLRFLGISEYKVIRVDFRFDSFESGHYQKYAKLNRYLISMLACAYSVKNKYRTSDLFSQKQLTVAIKNKYFECENYDKQKESDGKSETDGRLELRSKHWTDNDVEREFSVHWKLRWEKALENIEETWLCYNDELERIYDEGKNAFPVQFRSLTDFLIQYENCIFCKEQLVDLLSRLDEVGMNAAAIRAKNHMYRYGIKFYTLKDVKIVINEILRATKAFFAA